MESYVNIGTSDVSIPSDVSWISKIESKALMDSKYIFAIAANGGEARESSVSFIAADGSTRSITVSQAAKFIDILSVDPESLTFKTGGGEQTVSVTTFSEWSAVADSHWLKVVPAADGKSFSVTAESNLGESGRAAVERTAFIKVSTPTKSIDVKVTQNGENIPEGAINGLFTVSACKRVYFSRGNLVYITSSARWGFFEHQYDYHSAYNSDVISLFTWGYGTWSTDPQTSKFETGAFADWGTAIDSEGTWRTLSNNEWKYLLGTRGTGATYYKIGVNVCGSANCTVIAPDGNTVAIADSYDTSSWAEAEAAGFVCLPFVGYRSGTSIDFSYGSYYWSSTIVNNSTNAYGVNFKNGTYTCGANGRNWPYGVRLVSEY